MDTYATSIAASSMMVDDDGMYYGTVLASKHGLGENAFIVRAVHKDNTDLSQNNVLCAYETLSNGDIRVYADEPISLRITIGRGNPITTAIAGEGEEYADI